MSYRSLKRVLGETSLERKCRFLFGACLLFLITASFWWYGQQTEKLVYEQSQTTGRLLVDQALLSEHWEGLDTDQVFRYKPLVQNLVSRLPKQEYEFKYIIPNLPDKAYQPEDVEEQKILRRFLAAEPDETGQYPYIFADRTIASGEKYQYYQPVRAEASCLGACHTMPPGGIGVSSPESAPTELLIGSGICKSTARAAGDLLAVVRVTIPNGPMQDSLHWNRALLLSTAIITVFAAMIASYVIVRYVIVKPLKHLRDVSDDISRGNIALRADIHTGDEFEALAVAFNRMLRHLTNIQEELREANANLDGKVDELARANMQLYEMNRIKSDFLATMSHELRTPLNSILGFSEVLVGINALNDKQRRYVLNIQKSGRLLLDMINSILDLAKIESGKMEIRLSDFSLEQIIGAQCDMARPLAEKKNLDLLIDAEPDLPPMHQDQARVQQILNNLLSNAIKFTPEGGRITVSARRDDDGYLLLNVADTGVGIAEEDLETIFQKFRQARPSSDSEAGDAIVREYSGTGLGLSIVREICNLLRGEVTARSELGKGSVFTVRLPWTLEEQPKRDSPLTEHFDQLGRRPFAVSQTGG